MSEDTLIQTKVRKRDSAILTFRKEDFAEETTLIPFYTYRAITDVQYATAEGICLRQARNRMEPIPHLVKTLRLGNERMYTLTEPGARRLALVMSDPHLRYSVFNSTHDFYHEKAITDLAIAWNQGLPQAGIKIAKFTRWPSHLRTTVESNKFPVRQVGHRAKSWHSINPDWFMYTHDLKRSKKFPFYGDFIRAAENVYGEENSTTDKIRAYEEFFESGRFIPWFRQILGIDSDDFRVVFIYPTKARQYSEVERQHKVLGKTVTEGGYWFGNYDDCIRDPAGKVFLTMAGEKVGFAR